MENKEQFEELAIEIGFDIYEENGEFFYAETRMAYELFQAIKTKATPEGFVLDAPARVGGGVFREGVKWKTVIESAQRLYEHSKDKIKPIVSPADLLKIASGDLVLVPKESLKVALYWMDEDIDPWQMGGDSFIDLYEHKPILEKALEAQEQSHDNSN